MIPTLIIGDATIYQGNNLHILPELADNSVDAIVCDPPYELGFMGKSWDSSGIAYNVELWQECLRVLKPGGHLLAFSGSRTYHRMTVAIEDAGFEIRDMIAWISNKTFPKSHNISKAIDRAAGTERKVVGINQNVVRASKIAGGSDFGGFSKANPEITESATDEAKQWEGWGTGLKPTVEPIVLARKPVEGTIAENVLNYGVGGLNIDATRIGTETITINTFDNGAKPFGNAVGEPYTSKQSEGRWPANVIFDEITAEQLDKQSGIIKSGKPGVRTSDGFNANSYGSGMGIKAGQANGEYGDKGGASRFFYVARASKSDRNEGLDMSNNHPTVKPTALMQYLIRLVTPEGGVVLDPFTGSGSTGKAAILEGKRFIGIELTADYLPIIEGRLKHAVETMNTQGDDLFE
jgi:site-specific DNA-methyltransferase (adenine-specific)